MKQILKIILLVMVWLSFGFTSDKKDPVITDYFFVEQYGKFHFASGCFVLDRCVGSDITFDDPNNLLSGYPQDTYGAFVFSISSPSCVNRLVSWDLMTACP